MAQITLTSFQLTTDGSEFFTTHERKQVLDFSLIELGPFFPTAPPSLFPQKPEDPWVTDDHIHLCTHCGVLSTVEQSPAVGRCQFRTECIRRLLTGAVEAHPHCWQPLNWGRFEGSLQTLTTESAVEVINAHAAAVSITLDCVEMYRRGVVAKTTLEAGSAKANNNSETFVAAARASGAVGGVLEGGGGGVLSASMIAPLFIGAGGSNKDGREAVKKCAR